MLPKELNFFCPLTPDWWAQTSSRTISMSSRAQKFHLEFVMADLELLSEVPFEPILQIAAV